MDPQVFTALLEAADRGNVRGSDGVNLLKPKPDPAKYIQVFLRPPLLEGISCRKARSGYSHIVELGQ